MELRARFSGASSRIKYVGDADSKELVEDAIAGLLLHRLDPHSNYLERGILQ